jgi:hypothetical protein
VARFDAAFAILICVSLLFGPITWTHYLVLLPLPLAVLWRQLSAAGASGGRILRIGAVLVVPALLYREIPGVVLRFAAPGAPSQATPVVPLVPSLLSYLPTIGIIILLALIWRNDRQLANLSLFMENSN